MVVLPIVERELRAASRLPATYRARVFAAGLAILAAGFAVAITWSRPASTIGRDLFMALSIAIFLVSFLAGLMNTADCISSEKRNGTLGLLFLTDLKARDVILGKLAATSIRLVLALLATLPILSLPMLLGGVLISEFGRVALACANAAFLSLALGLLASVLFEDDRKAMGATALGIMLLLAGMPILAAYFESTGRLSVSQKLLVLAPSYGFAIALGITTRWATDFWTSLGIGHALAWGCLILACWRLPFSWQDKDFGSSGRKWRTWSLWLAYGASEPRKRLRLALLARNPILWLASRNRWQVPLVWWFLGISCALWLWGWAKNERYWIDPATFMGTAIVLNGILKIWVCTESSRCFAEARRVGAMELVLTTPTTVPEVVRGQILSLWRQFGKAAATILVVDIGFAFWGASEIQIDREKTEWWLVFSVILIAFVVDVACIAVVGMWQGILLGRANHAFGKTAAAVLVLPWILFALIMSAMGIMEYLLEIQISAKLGGGDVFPLLGAGLWLFCSLSVGVGFGWHSWRQLNRSFREICSVPLGTERSGLLSRCKQTLMKIIGSQA